MAGQRGAGGQLREWFLQRGALFARHLEGRTAGDQPLHAHLVERQRPGLINAEDCGRAQHFNGRHPPGQHSAPGDPPGSQREENRQHDGELFRDERDRQRESRQEALNPVTVDQPVQHRDQRADGKRRHRENPDDPPDFFLQAGFFLSDCLEGFPDLPHFGPQAGGQYLREPFSLYNQRAREHKRKIISPWRSCRPRIPRGDLAHRHRLPGQKGFVHREVRARGDPPVGRHPVPFHQQDEIPADHLLARNPRPLAAPDDQRAGTGKVPQSFQRAFGPALLDKADPDDQTYGADQQEGFPEVAEQELVDLASDQEQDHGLPDQFKRDF